MKKKITVVSVMEEIAHTYNQSSWGDIPESARTGNAIEEAMELYHKRKIEELMPKEEEINKELNRRGFTNDYVDGKRFGIEWLKDRLSK